MFRMKIKDIHFMWSELKRLGINPVSAVQWKGFPFLNLIFEDEEMENYFRLSAEVEEVPINYEN